MLVGLRYSSYRLSIAASEIEQCVHKSETIMVYHAQIWDIFFYVCTNLRFRKTLTIIRKWVLCVCLGGGSFSTKFEGVCTNSRLRDQMCTKTRNSQWQCEHVSLASQATSRYIYPLFTWPNLFPAPWYRKEEPLHTRRNSFFIWIKETPS